MNKLFRLFCLSAGLMAVGLPLGMADPAQPTALSTSREAASTGADHAEAETLGRFAREQWNLSEAEWTRYQTLMRGLRGSVSPASLSPIEVLGIHAQNEAERKDYARRWAKLMHEDAARILAFQAAYNEASRELNPGGQIIDTRALTDPAPQSSPIEWAQPGDRMLLFMPLDCLSCGDYLRAARAASAKGAQVDVYITGQAADAAILQWAAAQSFDPRAVQAKKITFNRENGELATVAGLGTNPPRLIRLRNRVAQSIEPSLPPKP